MYEKEKYFKSHLLLRIPEYMLKEPLCSLSSMHILNIIFTMVNDLGLQGKKVINLYIDEGDQLSDASNHSPSIHCFLESDEEETNKE